MAANSSAVLLVFLAVFVQFVPASAQTIVTLDPGDVYRINFTVNPAALPSGFIPDGGVMVSYHGPLTNCSGTVDITVYDAHRLIGYVAVPEYFLGTSCFIGSIFVPNPHPGFPWVLDDVGPIVTGSIQGSVAIVAVTQTQFVELAPPAQPWQVLLCNRQTSGVVSCVGDGVLYGTRTVIRAPASSGLCRAFVYFGNGIDTTQEDADDALKELRRGVQTALAQLGHRPLDDQCFSVAYAVPGTKTGKVLRNWLPGPPQFPLVLKA